MPPRGFREAVERVFRRHGAAALGSDPLQFPRRFPDPADREAAAFLAAALSFGNARSICASLERVFAWTGPRPARFLRNFHPRRGADAIASFRHRWTSGADLVRLAVILRGVLEEHRTIEGLFRRAIVRLPRGGVDLGASIERFRAGALAFDRPGSDDGSRLGPRYFFPRPRTSAAKRTAMFLRWVVRRGDEGLDLGLWDCLSPADLVAPLDTHLFRFARRLRLTRRRTPGWKAALDLTRGLARLDPEDPTKYDFALARLGIVEGCPRHRRSAPCELCELLAYRGGSNRFRDPFRPPSRGGRTLAVGARGTFSAAGYRTVTRERSASVPCARSTATMAFL